MIRFLFQLSELEQRVLEAEGRADEAEDKVSRHCINIHLEYKCEITWIWKG